MTWLLLLPLLLLLLVLELLLLWLLLWYLDNGLAGALALALAWLTGWLEAARKCQQIIARTTRRELGTTGTGGCSCAWTARGCSNIIISLCA